MEFLLKLFFDLALIVPAVVLGGQAVTSWMAICFGHSRSEKVYSGLSISAFLVSAFCSLSALLILIGLERSAVRLSSDSWFSIGHYSFRWILIADRLTLLFCLFSSLLTAIIAVFSRRYMHREAGYFRFYLLLTLFGMSANVIASAGTLESIFFGWELIGLASALLIGFFHERSAPLFSALRTYVTYRICDIGLLGAVIVCHVIHHPAAFRQVDAVWWLGLVTPQGSAELILVGLLLLLPVIGKSGLYPLGDWLPRAMEGPTSSSAIFYGAISVHLGVFLLLRLAGLLEASPLLAGLVVFFGVLTAFHGVFVGHAQTDIKSVLAYASMTQIGIIVVEIGLGFYTLAIVHMFGHALLRVLELLRAPSILQERMELERELGKRLPGTGLLLEQIVPKRLQPWLYRLALERGHTDTVLVDYVAGSFLRCARFLQRLEERWFRFISG